MIRALVSLGAFACALAVAAGAFGAHGLRGKVSAESLELWETAARYLIYGGFGTILAGLVALAGRAGAAGRPAAHPLGLWGAACLLAGSALFSGTVFALALGGPRWLGAVTPVGGLLVIAGFLFVAWSALSL